MTTTLDPSVIVIGGGQAGLAVSHELSGRSLDHVVLERGRVGQSWRDRWDSFCLVTPNWTLSLPGAGYSGDAPDAFAPRDEIVGYLEGYAAGLIGPVREGVGVIVLEPRLDPTLPAPDDRRRDPRGRGRRLHGRLPAPAPAGGRHRAPARRPRHQRPRLSEPSGPATREGAGDWVRFPAFDALGYPMTDNGASTEVPGLFFCGVHFLRKRKSALLFGVGEDAAVVADAVAASTRRPTVDQDR